MLRRAESELERQSKRSNTSEKSIFEHLNDTFNGLLFQSQTNPHEENKELSLDCTLELDLAQIKNSKSILKKWKQCKHVDDQLMLASQYGLILTIEKILGKNPDLVNQTDMLYQACLSGHEQLVCCLVEKYGANINKAPKDAWNSYPLMGAVGPGHVAIVKYLLDHGANANVQRNLVIFKESVIQSCQRELKWSKDGKLNLNHISIFRLLIEAGANYDEQHEYLKQSPMQYLETLKEHPECCAKIQEILSKENATANDLTEIMKHLNLDDNFDHLLYAFSGLSVTTDATDKKKNKPS